MPTPDRTKHWDLLTFQAGMELMVGNFTFNGTGEPDAAEGVPFRPSGLDLDRTGVGLYTLTIPGTGAVDVLAHFLQIVDTTLNAQIAQQTLNESARTIAITIRNDAATAIDPTDGSRLNVQIWFKTRPI